MNVAATKTLSHRNPGPVGLAKWRFVITATQFGIGKASHPPTRLPIEIPIPPPNLRTVIIELERTPSPIGQGIGFSYNN